MAAFLYKKGVYIYSNVMLAKRLKSVVKDSFDVFCLRLIYREASGPIGFDVDEDANVLFDFLLRNAWAWEPRNDRVKIYAEERSKISDPYYFVGTLGVSSAPANKITYHSPSKELVDKLENRDSVIVSIPFIESLDSLYDELINLIPLCEEIIHWNMAETEPLVFTSNYDAFIEKVKKACSERNVDITFVERQDQLPQW